MKKILLTLTMALFFASTVLPGLALAGSAKCKVDSVSDSKVVLDCGSDADDFSAGEKVKVKSAKKKKRIEGC